MEAVAPGLSVDQLRFELKEYNSETLGKFRAAFREMMGGIEFQSQSGNLIPIVSKLIKSQPFKDRFKGLAVFFDEFGFTLEKGAYSKDVLQGFMESICKNEHNVLFVGCIHKDFKSYADRFSKDDAAVMSARLTQVDLLNEGIEEIIGAIVETEKESELWKEAVEPKTGVFDMLVPPCKSLDLFPWIDDVNRIRQRVLEDIYGVHPMALACLLRLSSEIGSDARSTFTFFSGDVGGAAGSYAEFIENSDLTVAGGKLNLYTVDQLFTFFEKELSSKNPELRDRQRQFVNGYYASLDALRKAIQGRTMYRLEDHKGLKILKTVLIFQLCQIPASLDNIIFGLYALSAADKKQLDALLKDLVKNGALFFRKQSNTYELAAGTGEDPYELIDRYVSDPNLHPQDLVKAFLEEGGPKQNLDFLEAKGYNLPFNEDKRFRTRFVPAKDLGPAFWDEVRNDWEQNRNKPSTSFEGTLVYALCENDTEIHTALEAAKSIPDEKVALAIPHAPQPFTETLLKVKACRHYLPPSQAGNISAQMESRLRDLFENPGDGYLIQLQRIFNAIKEGEEACWYKKDGKILVDQPKQSHKPADMLADELFNKRCRIKHPDLNLSHDEKWRTGKNTALKQAVNVLLEGERVLIDNGNPENHGEKRYLEKVLLKGAGALRKTGTEGTVNYFSCERDPAKISDDFPVLKELCGRLTRLNPGESFQVGSFVGEVMAEPWGVGGTPMILALAHVIRAYGERLIVFKDSTKMVELPVKTYDDLCKIVSDPASKVVFEVREISEAQHKIIDLTASAVNAPPLKHGEVRTLGSAFEALLGWWTKVPEVARITTLYDKDRQSRLNNLKQLLGGLNQSADRFDVLLERLPSIYNGEKNSGKMTDAEAEEICQAFAEDVKLLNTGEQVVRRRIAEAVCAIYDAAGDMIECEKAIGKWHKELDPAQRDPAKCELEEASCLLTRLADQSASFDDKMMKLLPKDFGFGRVRDWTSLHVEDYATKLKQAKAEIDTAKTFVYKPVVEKETYFLKEKDAVPIKVPDGANKIVYTLDGTDPKQSSTTLVCDNYLDIAKLVKDQPKVKVKMRAVDADGNYSDPVSVELINKEKQYEIFFQQATWGTEGSFKCPNDKDGLVAVMKSLLNYATQKEIISSEMSQQVEVTLNKVLAEE